jgi:hypothetical protein
LKTKQAIADHRQVYDGGPLPPAALDETRSIHAIRRAATSSVSPHRLEHVCYNTFMPRESKQRIFRIPKVGNFTMIDNALLQDARLSWEARGLHAYLLSKPDTWDVRMRDLVQNGPAGMQKLRRMLKELVRAGYMIRERVKLPDGTFAWRTVYFDVSLEDSRSQDLIVQPNPPGKRSQRK